MRTSATGSAEGFTLIEVLVVLVILGVCVSLVVLNLQPDRGVVLDEEAQRLAGLLQHARDEAIVAGRSLAWRSGAEGYAFSRRENGAWAKVENPDSPLRPRPWPEPGFLSRVRIGGADAPLDAPVVFGPSGINAPFELVLAREGGRVTVTVDGTGQIVLQR